MKKYDGHSKTTNHMNVYQTLKTKFYEKETEALLAALTYSFNKKHLQALLDHALDQRDQEGFIYYSNLYNELLKNRPAPL
jgi:uncharacterized protein YpiB (UPF0302 family)